MGDVIREEAAALNELLRQDASNTYFRHRDIPQVSAIHAEVLSEWQKLQPDQQTAVAKVLHDKYEWTPVISAVDHQVMAFSSPKYDWGESITVPMLNLAQCESTKKEGQ